MLQKLWVTPAGRPIIHIMINGCSAGIDMDNKFVYSGWTFNCSGALKSDRWIYHISMTACTYVQINSTKHKANINVQNQALHMLNY
jgi:hypothetical protein